MSSGCNIGSILGSALKKETIYRDFMDLAEGEELYREIELSNGKGFILKIFSKCLPEGGVQVIQVGQREEPQGMAIFTADPLHFEDIDAFKEWLLEFLLKNFDTAPHISICPMDIDAIKAKEREHTSAMYW